MTQIIFGNFLGIFRAIKIGVALELCGKLGIFREKKGIMPLNKNTQWHYYERDEAQRGFKDEGTHLEEIQK